MDLSRYYSESDSGVSVSKQQASAFAKSVAGDFNPIHDVDAKRFCVPGDLLFSILLERFGLCDSIHVDFSAMVGADSAIPLPEQLEAVTQIGNGSDKVYLTLSRGDALDVSSEVIANLTKQYVMFSGKTFPDILVELMREHKVMINPDRPLVIYKDMAIRLDSLSDAPVELQYAGASMVVDGKKGQATLRFKFLQNGEQVGDGEKNMVLSGLREYDQTAMQAIVDLYNQWKSNYQVEDQAPA